MRTASTGATRDDNSNKPNYAGYLSAAVVRRFAQYMLKHEFQADGRRRSSDNWKNGMPRRWWFESLYRHFMAVFLWIDTGNCGYDDRGEYVDLEEALCGILFNTAGLLLEILLGRDLSEQETDG